MEDILEKDFGDDYEAIDAILDRIPENHSKIDVKPIEQTNHLGERRGSRTSFISNLNENSALFKKLFNS